MRKYAVVNKNTGKVRCMGYCNFAAEDDSFNPVTEEQMELDVDAWRPSDIPVGKPDMMRVVNRRLVHFDPPAGPMAFMSSPTARKLATGAVTAASIGGALYQMMG